MSGQATTIALVIIGILFVQSGVAGISVGGTPAQAGWWLVIVGVVLIGAAIIVGRRPSAT